MKKPSVFMYGTLPIVGCEVQLKTAKLLMWHQRHRKGLLKELRRIHGLTQEEFAERTGISYKYYQAVEGGFKKELRISTLERLADAYGIEVWQLLMPGIPKTKMRTPGHVQ